MFSCRHIVMVRYSTGNMPSMAVSTAGRLANSQMSFVDLLTFTGMICAHIEKSVYIYVYLHTLNSHALAHLPICEFVHIYKYITS